MQTSLTFTLQGSSLKEGVLTGIVGLMQTEITNLMKTQVLVKNFALFSSKA